MGFRDGVEIFIVGLTFEDISGCPGQHGLEDLFAVVEYRLDQYPDFRKMVADLPGGFNAIHAGHFNIHKDDIRFALGDMGKQFMAVCKRSDTGISGCPVEDGLHGLPEKRIVFKNRYADVDVQCKVGESMK